jgi:urease accessory protein
VPDTTTAMPPPPPPTPPGPLAPTGLSTAPSSAARDGTRSLRLGVAGPVGTGKSSVIALLCRELAAEIEIGVVTNDIYTDEDARFLRAAGVLDPERIRAVETGACPHTAIRDDVTANLMAVEDLEQDFAPLDLVLVESGGDNLTATFSPALVDAQIFVLDVAGGGDVARKGGPGIARADLLLVNKTDLAPYVGVDVARMVIDASAAREGRPVLALSRQDRASVEALAAWLRELLASHHAGVHVPQDPGPMAPHVHADQVGAHSQDHPGGGHSHRHTHTPEHDDAAEHADRAAAFL